jgi:hypothetical protein
VIALALFTIKFQSAAYGQTQISGYVLSRDTADVIANALVFLKNEFGLSIPERSPVQADEDGFYEFTNVEPGKYQVSASGAFLDRNGDEYHIMLVANAVDVPESGLEMHFGFSPTELKLRGMVDAYTISSTPTGHNGVRLEVDPWLSARMGLIRSVVMDGDGKAHTAISFPDRIPDL